MARQADVQPERDPDATRNSPTETAGPAPTPRAAPQSGYAMLARRMRNWAGNVLATCVIVVLGLVFGRQVLSWWRGAADVTIVPQAVPGPDAEAFADPAAACLLAFGDLPLQLERAVFTGDEEAALAQLRTRCRAVPAALPWRPGLRALAVSDELLRQLDGLAAVEQGDGWKIVQHGGPVITVVLLRTRSESASEGRGDARQFAKSVVSWGLGLRRLDDRTKPARTDRWTLFTCAGVAAAGDSDGTLQQPIPPGSHRTLAVRVERGGALIGWAGSGTLADWQQFFDQDLPRQGWSVLSGWQRLGAGRYARFGRRDGTLCEIQIAEQANGALLGLLTITPTVPAGGN